MFRISISRAWLMSVIITLLAFYPLIDCRALADSLSPPTDEALIELLRSGGYSL